VCANDTASPAYQITCTTMTPSNTCPDRLAKARNTVSTVTAETTPKTPAARAIPPILSSTNDQLNMATDCSANPHGIRNRIRVPHRINNGRAIASPSAEPAATNRAASAGDTNPSRIIEAIKVPQPTQKLTIPTTTATR